MVEKSERQLVQSPDALASPVADETVVLQLKSGTYFGLDAMGTRIWALLGTGNSPAAICRQLDEEFDVPEDVIRRDVTRFLAELEQNGLIADSGGQSA